MTFWKTVGAVLVAQLISTIVVIVSYALLFASIIANSPHMTTVPKIGI
jgi:hypothetical protein